MPIVAGRVTAIDRVARTLSLGLFSFTLKPDVPLRGIEVGGSVSFVSEEADDGRLVVTDLVRLSF
jgi:Cu/Ag efflux protein CusF